MDLLEVLDQVRDLLRTKGRMSYRMLQAQFHLDDTLLEGLKDELIEAERVAADENGKVIVWCGEGWVEQLETRVSDLRCKMYIEGAGHWVQMERPAPVNEALISFLRSLS